MINAFTSLAKGIIFWTNGLVSNYFLTRFARSTFANRFLRTFCFSLLFREWIENVGQKQTRKKGLNRLLFFATLYFIPFFRTSVNLENDLI